MNQFQIISSPTPISLAIISGVDLLRFEGLAIMVILGEEIQFILVSLWYISSYLGLFVISQQ